MKSDILAEDALCQSYRLICFVVRQIRGHQFKAGEQRRSSVCCSSDNADIGLSTCSWSTKKFPGKALTS